jgi:outer membrane protein OmpA-like peptidoglycan-associated protein
MQLVPSTEGRDVRVTGPDRSGRRWRRAWTAAAAGAALGAAGLVAAPTAMATVLTATSTTVTGPINASGTTSIPGVSVNGAGNTDIVNVTISTTVGSLTLPTTSGLTAANAYTFAGPIVSFTGLQSDVNTDLASLTLTTSGASISTPATVSVSAYVDQPGFIYSPSNQHFYKYVASNAINWTDARSQALSATYTPSGLASISGYLASIPNATVNSLIAAHTGASNFWFGADGVNNVPASGQRQWQWSDGPLHAAGGSGDVISNCASDANDTTCSFDAGSGYSAWNPGEPNNANGTESVAVDNYNGNAGLWNDLNPTSTVAAGYLVEFGNQVTGSSGGTGVATASGSLPIFTAPAAPTAVTAISSGTSAIVSWTGSSSNGGYPLTATTVTATPGGATCSPATPTGTSCTIAGLTLGTNYTFSVTSANAYATSNASAASSSVPIFTAPAAPTAVTAISSGTSAIVSWTGSSSNGGYPLTATTVTATPGGATCSPATPTDTTCTIPGLTRGTSYTFSVTSANSYATSAASTASSLLTVPTLPVTPTTPPGTPTLIHASALKEGAAVSWSIPVDTGGTALTGFTVVYQDLTEAAHTVIDTVGASATSDTAALVPGDRYSASVTALNAVGAGIASAAAVVVPFTNPQAPTSVTATPGTGTATVYWAAPADTGYTAITGYRVSVTDEITGATQFVSVGPVPGTVLRGLIAGRSYSVAVFALNAAGASLSASASTTVILTPPFAVSPVQRKHEVPVPAHPATVRGPVRLTSAYGRSHNGTPAFAATGLQGYQLQAHQAVDLSNDGLFGYNSVQLTARGRAVLRGMVLNFRHAAVVTCEGYSDYAVAPSDARRVSLARARTVCRTLRADGARVRTQAIGYGGRDPVAVGGTIRQRGLNRRVVLYIDR